MLVLLGVMCLFPTLARAAPARIKVGYYNKNTSTGAGTESFTHNLTTTPKAMILWTSNQASTPTTAPAAPARFLASASPTGPATTALAMAYPTSPPRPPAAGASPPAIQIVNGSGTVSLEGTVAFTSTQVTFTWSTRTSAAATGINYILFGGNVLEAKVAQWTTGTSNPGTERSRRSPA